MANKDSEALVLTSKQNGIVVIPMGTELTRLNYFDGKFLRASDLKAEQDYLRALVQQSNQAGGSGVAHGFDVTLGNQDTLNIGPGLAIDGEGRVLLMPQGTSFGIQNLINKSRELEKLLGKSHKGGNGFGACEEKSETPAVNTTHPNGIYKIVISAAEALCGEEDVYGKLCEEACATSTDRPLIIEGVVVRAVPLEVTPIMKGQLNQTNLRSRTAAAYFEFERTLVSSLISGDGLKEQTWCRGANPADDGGVAIAVIARAGTATTVFLDPWIIRRELIDTPARRYWQWRMMMRPWDVFLAQILQFQCQLRDLYKTSPDPVGDAGPCGEAKDALNEAAQAIAEIQKFYEATTARFVEFRKDFREFEGGSDRLITLNKKLASVHKKLANTPADRWLINGGIIELPSAGYLPVVPGVEVTVNQQVRKMMGEGVNLRFCVVRPDFVAHALEEAQHMERISLIEGLENPAKKPEVDILVPDGELVAVQQPETRVGYAADGEMRARVTFIGESERTLDMPKIPFKGAARPERLPSGGMAVHLGASSPALFTVLRRGLNVERWRNLGESGVVVNPNDPPELGLWVSLRCDKKLMGLQIGETTKLSGTIVTAINPQAPDALEFRGRMDGLLTVDHADASGNLAGNFAVKFSIVGDNFPLTTGLQTLRFTVLPLAPNAIKISVTGKNTELHLVGDWSDPAEIGGVLSFIRRERPPDTYEISLPVTITKDANVFSPADTHHMHAITGLEYVAGPLADQTFVAEATNLLFPPGPVATSGESLVRATRDWVLFHRRRTKQCAEPAEPAKSRRYRVYQFAAIRNALRPLDVRVDVAGNRASALGSAIGSTAETPFGSTVGSTVGSSIGSTVGSPPRGSIQITDADLRRFKAIGEVEFGAGVATFASDITALKNAWKKVFGGGILFGAIGSRGDAVNDGDSLSLNRLKTLQHALDRVSPSVHTEVLPTVPTPLIDPNFDGVILLINGAGLPTYYDYYDYYGYGAANVGVGGGLL